MNALSIKTKVNRIGLIGKIISIILIVLMATACAALIVGGIVLTVLQDGVQVGVSADMDITVDKSLIGPYMDKIDENALSEINASLRVNGEEFKNFKAEKTDAGLFFRAATERIVFTVNRFASVLLAGLVACACMLVIFVFLLRLCDAFRRCDTPFADDVVRKMTVFAWVLLGASAVASVAEAVCNSLMARSVDFEFSLNPAGLDSGMHLSVSFAPILIALIVLFLTMIFRYGAALQKEADETL